MTDKWRKESLGDLLIDARSGFASGENTPDGVFQIRMNNVTPDGGLDMVSRRRVPPPKQGIQRFLLEPGDVIYNATNSAELVGKSAVFLGSGEPTVFSNHFIRLRTKADLLEGRYLARWLHTQFLNRVFEQRCRRWVNQATFDRDSLLSMTIPFPPIEEQQRIAAVLDTADELRTKIRTVQDTLDTLTDSIFIEMFGDPVSNPMDWPSDVELSNISEIVSGITKGRQIGSQDTRSVPYLAVANVQDGRLNLNVVKSIEATEQEIDRLKLHPGDLLLTEGGDPDKLGRGTIWSNEIPECIHQNHIFRVRIHSPSFRPAFVSRLVSSERGKQYFLKSAKQTTGIASINKTQLGRFRVLSPPLNLQYAYEERVESVIRLKMMGADSIKSGDDLFASLQQRAFEGTL